MTHYFRKFLIFTKFPQAAHFPHLYYLQFDIISMKKPFFKKNIFKLIHDFQHIYIQTSCVSDIIWIILIC